MRRAFFFLFFSLYLFNSTLGSREFGNNLYDG